MFEDPKEEDVIAAIRSRPSTHELTSIWIGVSGIDAITYLRRRLDGEALKHKAIIVEFPSALTAEGGTLLQSLITNAKFFKEFAAHDKQPEILERYLWSSANIKKI